MSIKASAMSIGLLCIAMHVHAQEPLPVHWELGAEYYRETYREQLHGLPFMQEKAGMAGLNLNVSIPFTQLHAMTFMARYAAGKSTYTGAMEDEPYGSVVMGGQDRHTLELRTAYEMTLAHVTPSLGIGYRRLVDRLDQGGDGGYRRISEYVYASAGLASTITLGQSGLMLTPKMMYHHLLRGRQRSDEWVNWQRDGYGVELSAALRAPMSRATAWVLTPYYRYWHIDDSEVSVMDSKTFFMEPQNTTHEVGLRMSVAF